MKGDTLQKQTGLPDGHAWLRFSRWDMCWRVTLASATVGMLGALLLGLIGLADSSRANIFFSITGVLFGLVPAPVFGGLAALIGPWVRRFFPVSQGLLFGFIGACTCAVILFIVDGADSILHPCQPTTACFAPLTGALLVSLIAGIPLAIMSGAGWALAVHVAARRRRLRIFTALFVVTVLVFASAQILGLLGSSSAPKFEEPAGPVCGTIQNGEHVEAPCAW